MDDRPMPADDGPLAGAPPPSTGRPAGLPSQPADAGESAGVRMLIPVGRSGLAIAAGYCGLVSLFPCIGMLIAPVAIVLAVMAHRRLRKDARLHGMGRVVFAYIAGGLSLALHLLLLVMHVAGGLSHPH